MNAPTLIENVEHYISIHTNALAKLNRQQADRLSQGGDVILDYSQIANRISAQARALIAADLRRVLDTVSREGVSERAEAVRRYLTQSLAWVRTPSSTSAVSNAMDAELNDQRIDLARLLGVIGR